MPVRPRHKGPKHRASTVQVRKKSSLAHTPLTPTNLPRKEDFSLARKQVVVTILTGGRPLLLMKTLKSLAARAPRLVEEARVVALINGGDKQSVAGIDYTQWVDEKHQTDELLPIGAAFSELMRRALDGKQRYVLHLEDDWVCCADEDSWFHKAIHTIENLGVGQVRLRNAREMVMSANALSHQKIKWKKLSDSLSVAKNAHFTFNPSLVPTAVMQGLHPCSGEIDAMRKYGASQLAVAQLSPGAFLHTGENQSLADKTGGR